MKQKGLTLIELMISMVLGLILTAGVMSLFIQSQRSYSAARDIAILDQNAQVIMDMMERDLQRIGYTPGCRTYNGPLQANLLVASSNAMPFIGDRFSSAPQFKGFHRKTGGPLVDDFLTATASSLQASLKNDSDFFMAWAGNPDKVGAITSVSGSSYNAIFESSTDDLNGEVVMISSPDCTQVAQFLQTTNTSAGAASTDHANIEPAVTTSDGISNFSAFEVGNFDNSSGTPVDETITPSGAIMVLEYFGYAVNDSNQLIRISSIGSPDFQTLTNGVNNLTMTYGSHNNTASNGVYSVARYDSAENVPDWSAVIAVRVNITLEGETRVNGNKFNKTYSRLITIRNLVIK